MRRVLAFYKFIPVTDPEARVEELQQLGEQLDVVGTILLAEEGVNGTIVAETDSLDAMVRALETETLIDVFSAASGFSPIEHPVMRPVAVSVSTSGLIT